MAGHNKWSKVKHRKAVVDKRRAKAWSMCSRAIISVARQGGPDPEFNFALRAAIDEARYYNVPQENIERAIKKGAGGGTGDNFEPVRYEGYGPGGVAIVVDALTDNRTRTAADVRNIFAENAGKFGASGSVAHLFKAVARITIVSKSVQPLSSDAALEAALNAGADDCVESAGEDDHSVQPGTWDVLCPPTELAAVKASLAAVGTIKVERSGFDMLAITTTQVSPADAEPLAELIDALEDNDDVKHVYSNAVFPEA
ncbi:MAG: YebC/PmpR family DNA-binding transcriptional regulator [Phycisphaerales bacterium]|nr:YebC/PmpR family DNA-binding transcriptional regulator [Phycisphaeraceae bacterium]